MWILGVLIIIGVLIHKNHSLHKEIDKYKRLLKEVSEDYKNDFDSEKPYYRIKDHWTGAQYYTNDVERIESILEEEINLEEVFKVTE